MSFKVAFTTHDAALYACKKWHYSGCLPDGKKNVFGVWEDGRFIGVVVFGRGANNKIASPFGLTQKQVVELTRVALTDHETPVTKILKVCLKLLIKHNPKLELIVSYADSSQNHHGGIYQGGNWIYIGEMKSYYFVFKSKKTHPRTLNDRYGTHAFDYLKSIDPNVKKITDCNKHKYVYPFSNEWRKKLSQIAKPYPKRPKQAMADPSAQRECNAHRAAPL